ncbi:energy-coupling factor transporter transmembrane component T [Streptomyces luteocolor]|uniref:energy-coupling factor transporter transmembrane component T n=1 Tax=Streptomyces luteocolor TaxID=285500 RepID=UPI000A3E3ED7|nr:energy-coupling factor transporter transmembrane component T [Streptomyces luteocolor]
MKDHGSAAPGGGLLRRHRAPEAHRSNALHPGAWWLWALGLGTAASRTTNPLVIGLLIGVAGYVVAARRTNAPWAKSYGAFVKLGLVVIGIRLVFAIVLGSPIPGTHVLVTLPEVPLPDWARGVRIGGRVTAEGLLFALYDGIRLAGLLICVGAANALASPARLLKSLPGALYEVGVAVVVAMTFAPNLITDVQRLRAARRLRGRPDRGLRGLLQVGLPVLEGALERSVALAAAMDARGFGRTAAVPAGVRRATAVLTLGGLIGVCVGAYGLLTAQGTGYGLPVLAAGLLAALAGLRLGGRRSLRTRYRPDPWGVRAWLVAGSGVAVAGLMIWAASYDPAPLHPGVVPLIAPTLPLWPALAVLIGLLPAFVAPVPPAASAPVRAGRRTGTGKSGRTEESGRTGRSGSVTGAEPDGPVSGARRSPAAWRTRAPAPADPSLPVPAESAPSVPPKETS